MINDNDKKHLESTCQLILDLAKKAGATSAEVSVGFAKGFSVESRMGQVDTVEHNHDNGVNITVFRGKAMGVSSTTDMNTDALAQAVQAAINIAKYTQDDPCNGLADKTLMATNFPDLKLFHPWGITPEQAIEKTIECEAIARDYDKRLTNSDGVTLSSHAGIDVYANSHGFIGVQQDTRHQFSCSMIAEHAGEMQRDYEYTVARDPHDLLKTKDLALSAAKNTLARLGSRTVKTQKTPVLFRADVARSLLRNFSAAIRGSALHRKASFLLDSLEQQLFPEWFNLQEQPYLPSALASSSFDNEGVQTQQKYFIEKGRLTNYCLDSYSARKLGMQTTANGGGIYNLIATVGDKSVADLLKELDTGLFVTEVMGQGVNIATGDYSRGASGFWVEQGEIQFPVSEITIAGNLKEMFQNIVAIGSDIDQRSSIRNGSLLISEMMLAGN